jgi:[histone H3]-lysine36 N-dimethyltransferase SETMAR
VQQNHISVVVKMDHQAFRGAIFHLHLKGLNATEVKAELDSVHRESAPSYETVRYWINELKGGRSCSSDAPRSGRPKTATDQENVRKVHQMVMSDRRINIDEIAEALKISAERVHHVLHEDLDMSKISARWVPRLLTAEQKLLRVTASEAGLRLIEKNRKDFWRRLVTVDETWIHYYTPETKQDSKQWTKKSESAPVKAKVVPSAGKVMATVFWDSKGILLIDYLQKGSTITGVYYASLLDQLDDAIRSKRPGLQRKSVLFLQDNAPAHKAAVVMAKLHELRYQLVDHPPYSPDLAPSDFFLFAKLKKHLSGVKYSTNDAVVAATEGFFDDLDGEFFSEGLKGLEHRWAKCIAIEGDYVEK